MTLSLVIAIAACVLALGGLYAMWIATDKRDLADARRVTVQELKSRTRRLEDQINGCAFVGVSGLSKRVHECECRVKEHEEALLTHLERLDRLEPAPSRGSDRWPAGRSADWLEAQARGAAPHAKARNERRGGAGGLDHQFRAAAIERFFRRGERASAAAARLGIHPSTVRRHYRRLREERAGRPEKRESVH